MKAINVTCDFILQRSSLALLAGELPVQRSDLRIPPHDLGAEFGHVGRYLYFYYTCIFIFFSVSDSIVLLYI